jgi:hypothetical protein
LVLKVDGFGWTKFFTASAFTSDEINALRWIDAILQRNGLGILHVNRLAFGQSRVICIGNFFGAFLCTGTAGDAFFHVHVARVLGQVDLEITGFAGNVFDFGKGQEFDIDVPADLDQFG